jgi:hypothetical protein
LSSLANGESYRVQLTWTMVTGQAVSQSASVSVAAVVVGGWATVADWDFTANTPQSGLGPDGTYTLALTAGNVTLKTSTISGVNVPSATASLGASGLDLAVARSSGTGGATKTFALDLSGFAGLGDLDPDKNDMMVEFVWENVAYPSTDTITPEFGESDVAASNAPGFFAQYKKTSTPTWVFCSGNRSTTNNAASAGGSSLGGTMPANAHIQLIGKGRNWEVRGETSSAASDPWTPTTYKGDCGLYASASPADTAINIWGTNQWILLSLTANSATAVNIRVKRIRVQRRTPLAA